MLGGLSDREKAILRYIAVENESRGYPPSVREIGQAVGLRSSSTVHGYLERLEAKGYIRRDPTKPRAIEVILGDDNLPRSLRDVVSVPLVGRVTAGQPILAVENIDEYYPLPKSFVADSEVFLLKVSGDSMMGAGILDGDMVIVRRQANASNGDIVVALLDDEATVKRFHKADGHIRLEPENPAFKPIITSDAALVGKVVGLIRRIH